MILISSKLIQIHALLVLLSHLIWSIRWLCMNPMINQWKKSNLIRLLNTLPSILKVTRDRKDLIKTMRMHSIDLLHPVYLYLQALKAMVDLFLWSIRMHKACNSILLPFLLLLLRFLPISLQPSLILLSVWLNWQLKIKMHHIWDVSNWWSFAPLLLIMTSLIWWLSSHLSLLVCFLCYSMYTRIIGTCILSNRSMVW